MKNWFPNFPSAGMSGDDHYGEGPLKITVSQNFMCGDTVAGLGRGRGPEVLGSPYFGVKKTKSQKEEKPAARRQQQQQQ